MRLQERLFRIDFRLAVQRNRLHMGVLIHQQIGRSVYATAGRKYKTLDAIPSGDLDQHSCRGVIDLQTRLTINFARGISYDCGQVNDRFGALDSANHILDFPAIAYL